MAGTTEKTPEQIQAFVKAGEKHQFGAEKANPQAQDLGLSAGSIRKNIKYLARQTPDGEAGSYKLSMPRKPTMAQILAAHELEAAANREPSEQMRRIEFLTEQIDGKLHQVNVNTDLDKFEGMTEEELHDYNRKLDERIAAATGAGENGTQQPAGGDDAAGNAPPQGAGSAPIGEGQGANEISPGAIGL